MGEARAFFASLEIEVETAWEIFKLLDIDGGGTLDIEEFVTGCLRLRGPAKALDVARVFEMGRRTDEMMTIVLEQLESMKKNQNIGFVGRQHSSVASTAHVSSVVTARTTNPRSSNHAKTPWYREQPP